MSISKFIFSATLFGIALACGGTHAQVPDETPVIPEGPAETTSPTETVASSGETVPPGIVAVRLVYDGDTYLMTGVTVGRSAVLTSDIAVRNMRSDGRVVTPSGEIVSMEIVARDEDARLVLWTTSQPLDLPVPQTAELPDIGRTTRILYADGDTKTVAGVAATDADGERGVSHTSNVPFKAFGGAVLNRCGQMIGVNTPTDDYRRRDLRQRQDGDPLTHIVSSDTISSFLAENGLSLGSATAPCASQLEQARRDTEAARDAEQARRDEAERLRGEAAASAERATELRERAEELEAAAESAQSDRAAAQRAAAEAQAAADEASALAADADKRAAEVEAEANDLLADLNEAEASLTDLEARLAEAESEVESWQLYAAIGGGLAALIALVSLFLIFRGRGKTRVAQESADDAQREVTRLAAIPKAIPPVDDILLEGKDRNLLLSGKLLPEAAGGVVVGRHPERASAVLEAEDVSRRHARIFVTADGAMIEDLGSSFGTSLNTTQLAPNQPLALGHGDIVAIAGHTFTCVMLGRRRS
ncbi:MAG: FHA domain-containing protein [Pseudomonadota bacterium]